MVARPGRLAPGRPGPALHGDLSERALMLRRCKIGGAPYIPLRHNYRALAVFHLETQTARDFRPVVRTHKLNRSPAISTERPRGARGALGKALQTSLSVFPVVDLRVPIAIQIFLFFSYKT